MKKRSILIVLGFLYLYFITAFATLSSGDGDPSQMEALMELYKSTGGGTTWIRTCVDLVQQKGCWGTVSSTSSFCDWYGVTCSVPNPNDENAVVVIGLDLSNNGLVGEIPPSIGQLCNLTSLQLQGNQLQGIIPNVFGNHSALLVLRLDDNQLSGNIPSSIASIPNLKTLDLSNNSLSGSIPYGLFNMPTLEYLVLANNLLTGILPKVTKITSQLRKLVVSHNLLSGQILIHEGNPRFPFLTQFSVSNNNFTGPIEEGLYYLFTNPSVMDFSWNNLSGSISARIRQMAIGTTLSFFSIYGNPLMKAEGGIPSYYAFNNNTLEIGQDTTYYCFSVYQGARLRVAVSPVYFNYTHCRCSQGFYGVPPDCQPCPINCVCNGGENFAWQRGFFPIFAESGSASVSLGNLVLSSMTNNDTTRPGTVVLQTIQCTRNNDTNCNPANNCSAGYDKKLQDNCALCSEGSAGRLCSKCECYNSSYCYYKSFNGVCKECGDKKIRALFLCMFLLLLVGAAFLVLYLKQKVKMLMAKSNIERAVKIEDTIYQEDSRTEGSLYGYLDGRQASGIEAALKEGGEEKGEGEDLYYKEKEQEEEEFEEISENEEKVLLLKDEVYEDEEDEEEDEIQVHFSEKNINSNNKELEEKKKQEKKEEEEEEEEELHFINECGNLKVLIIFIQTTTLLNRAWPHTVWHDLGLMHFYPNGYGYEFFTFGVECLFHEVWRPLIMYLTVLGAIPAVTGLLFMVTVMHLGWTAFSIKFLNKHRGDEDNDDVEDDDDGYFPLQLNENDELVVVPKRGKGIFRRYFKRSLLWACNLWLFGLWFFYFTVSVKTFETFNCNSEPITGTKYLQAYPWLECSRDTEWITLLYIAIVILAVYVIGVPVFYSLLYFVFRNRLERRQVKYALGSFYCYYADRRKWYEIFILLRRLLLAMFIAALPEDTAFRSAGIFTILVIALALQQHLAPFRSYSTNVLEALGLIILLVTYASMTTIASQLSSTTLKDDVTLALSVFVLALNLLFVIGAVLVILWPFAQVLKKLLDAYHQERRERK